MRKLKNSRLVSLLFCLALMLTIVIGTSFNLAAASEGKLKLINSWGETWGAFNDGSLYITYQAAINNAFPIYVVDPKDDYEPQAIAVFKLDGQNRAKWEIKVNAGSKSKTFYPKQLLLDKGGNKPFPNNKLVLDITELMPFNGSNISLQIRNGSNSWGSIGHFSIEIYDNYASNPIDTYVSNEVPANVQARGVKTLSVNNVVAKKSYSLKSDGMNLNKMSRKLTKDDIDEFTANQKTNLLSTNNNLIIDGHGTGYRPLSKSDWEEAMKEDSIRVLDSKQVLNSFSNLKNTIKVDHSQSKYFPPVGNQGEEGSCAAWAMTYYTTGYLEARDRNWNLTAFDSTKLLSPGFTYSLVNGGRDQGSHMQDIVKVNANIGASTWAKMPYNGYDSDVTSWGSEAAFHSAPKFRSDIPQTYFINVTSMQDIEALKSLLANGYVVVTAVDAQQYSSSGTWTANNYNASDRDLNHANTVVGFEEEGNSDQKPDPANIRVEQNNTDSNYKVKVVVPAGNTANSMKLYEDNRVVKTADLIANNPNQQIIEYSAFDKQEDSYQYYAELSNNYGITKSEFVVVNVGEGYYPTWQSGINYQTGDLVSYNGKNYKCLQGHTSLTGWEPDKVPALWELQ